MTATKKKKETTLHPADVYAGATLRRLRIASGFSQDALGKKVNLTFQQIQKYERGENGMRASRIHEFCQILKASPLEFFSDDLNFSPDEADLPQQSLKLIRLFKQIPELSDRQVVVNVAESIVKKYGIEGDLECQL